MRPTPRNIVALLIAVLVAAACIRLGLWQLDRRAQRLAINELAEARMHAPPARSVGDLASDTGAARYRPVVLTGTWDFEHEIILTGRTHQGSPGVNLITPLHVPGEEQAILVNRGWVYAPDGATIDAPRWREPAEATVRGYAVPFPQTDGAVTVRTGSVRRLAFDTVAALIPYPLAPLYVVDTAAAAPGIEAPVPIGGIALDAGPHLGYAVQWFSFATIAVIGVGILVWRDRRTTRAEAQDLVTAPDARQARADKPRPPPPYSRRT